MPARTGVGGVFKPLDFVIPTDSYMALARRAPAAAAAIVMAPRTMSGYTRRGMSGGYRGMGDASSTASGILDSIMSFAKDNPLMAGGLVLGAVLLTRGGGRRR